MRKCPDCETPIPDGVAACPGCGLVVDLLAASDGILDLARRYRKEGNARAKVIYDELDLLIPDNWEVQFFVKYYEFKAAPTLDPGYVKALGDSLTDVFMALKYDSECTDKGKALQEMLFYCQDVADEEMRNLVPCARNNDIACEDLYLSLFHLINKYSELCDIFISECGSTVVTIQQKCKETLRLASLPMKEYYRRNPARLERLKSQRKR